MPKVVIRSLPIPFKGIIEPNRIFKKYNKETNENRKIMISIIKYWAQNKKMTKYLNYDNKF